MNKMLIGKKRMLIGIAWFFPAAGWAQTEVHVVQSDSVWGRPTEEQLLSTEETVVIDGERRGTASVMKQLIFGEGGSTVYLPEFKGLPWKSLSMSVVRPEPLQGLSRADYPSFGQGVHSVLPGFQPQLNVSRPLVLPYFTNPSPLFLGDYSTSGVLFPFRYGAIVGAGSQTTLPGIGRLNEASLGLVHSLGDRWTLQLGLQARKFSFPYAVGQHFATSGMLQYQAADRLVFRVFGSYTAGPSYGYSTRSYGGSMLLQLSDRFSLEAGVQRQYNPLRGGWETVPMLVPTYKFNKFELGLDVGGLLYQLLHTVVIDNDRMRMGNPTIGPPTTIP